MFGRSQLVPISEQNGIQYLFMADCSLASVLSGTPVSIRSTIDWHMAPKEDMLTGLIAYCGISSYAESIVCATPAPRAGFLRFSLGRFRGERRVGTAGADECGRCISGGSRFMGGVRTMLNSGGVTLGRCLLGV